MTETSRVQGASSEIHQSFVEDAEMSRERMYAIFAWQLTEGDYHLITPRRPISVPDNFVPKHDVNSTEITFSVPIEDESVKVLITRGITSIGGNGGLKEEPDDITVDIDNLPEVYRFRADGSVSAESRYVKMEEFTLDGTRFSRFDEEGDDTHTGRRILPLSSRPLGYTDLFYINSALDNLGDPSNSGVDVEVIETHRDRSSYIGQRD